MEKVFLPRKEGQNRTEQGQTRFRISGCHANLILNFVIELCNDRERYTCNVAGHTCMRKYLCMICMYIQDLRTWLKLIGDVWENVDRLIYTPMWTILTRFSKTQIFMHGVKHFISQFNS